MLSRRVIATLIAGSFAAAQAGAHSYLSNAAGSISGHEYQAQASQTTPSEESFPEQVTVFNPDGSSYTLVADAHSVMPDAELLVMTAESMPEHLTVFDPDGTVTAYDFVPVDVAYLEPMYDVTLVEMDDAAAPYIYALVDEPSVILVEVAEPIIVAYAADGATSSGVWFDTEGAPWSIPDHVAAFDEALKRTG
jgi:hypothetical protein